MAFLRQAVETVGALGSPIEREIYGNKAAQAAGITGAAFAQEVERWRKGQSRQAKRKEQRQSMVPTMTHQPRSRSLRYENIRSALAEEGVLRLVMLEPSLFEKVDLTGEEFSSQLLGRAFQLLRDRHARGLAVQLPALAGELNSEEMSHLTEILSQPESLAYASRAMEDYIKTIRAEGAQRSAPPKSEEALLELRRQQREKTMEDGQ